MDDIRPCFDDNEDYYKPIKTKDVLDDNCLQFESRDDQDKKYSLEECRE